MPSVNELISFPWVILLVIIVIWDMVWKMIALWKAARNNDLAWFILIGVVNSVGIIPIIYILLRKNKYTAMQSRKRYKGV